MNIKATITAIPASIVFTLTAFFVSAQGPERIQLPITGITINDDMNVTLEWDNYGVRKDITGLELEEATSLTGTWSPTPGLDLTKACCGATVVANSPRSFYRLFATVAKVRVTFDANGGSPPSFPTKEITPGTIYGSLPEYDLPLGQLGFAGWWTEQAAGTQVTESTVVTNESDHTLWACWASIEKHPDIIITNNAAHAFTLPAATGTMPLDFTYAPYWVYGDGTLPPGFTFDSSNHALTITQGAPVGRYWLNLNTMTGGRIIVVSHVIVEVREPGTYWVSEQQPDSLNQFKNIENMFKTTESDTPFAYHDLSGAWALDRHMYPQRPGIGNEQLPYVRPIASSVDIRAWRSRNTNNANNLLHAYVEIYPTYERKTVMYDNATNPDANTWTTITGAVPLIPRGGTGIIGFKATNSHVSGTDFRVAWARFNVTWAPPETGLTGIDGHHDR